MSLEGLFVVIVFREFMNELTGEAKLTFVFLLRTSAIFKHRLDIAFGLASVLVQVGERVGEGVPRMEGHRKP